jgi:hypothetical protein
MDISTSIEQAIASYFSNWLSQHVYLAWILAHPLPSLLLLIVGIFLLLGLFKAIGRGMERVWVFLLKTPFRLLQPLFRLIWRSIWRLFGHNNFSESKLAIQTTPERIESIVDRLHILAREQELLLGELSTLTATPVKPEQRFSKGATEPTQSDPKYRKL